MRAGLLPAVIRRLNGSMPAPKPSISLTAASLETSGPELGTPDLTEHRIIIKTGLSRRTTAERDCYQYLLEQMQASPDRPSTTRAKLENTCRPRFRVKAESFDYTWREAIKVTGARWDQPGRRSR